MIQKNRERKFVNEFSPQVNKLFFWFAFFMAFPSVIIFQNISIYIFIVMLLYLVKSGYSNFGLSKNLHRLAGLFVICVVV